MEKPFSKSFDAMVKEISRRSEDADIEASAWEIHLHCPDMSASRCVRLAVRNRKLRQREILQEAQ